MNDSRMNDSRMNDGIAPYYDPYDATIDANPYPVWKRLRDEAPPPRRAWHSWRGATVVTCTRFP
jgi:hypothetical protein